MSRGHPTEPDLPQTEFETRSGTSWRTRRRLLAVTTLVVVLYSSVSLPVLLPSRPPTWTADFDWDRYAEIYEAIKADEHHLLGKSFDEVSKRLGLRIRSLARCRLSKATDRQPPHLPFSRIRLLCER